MKLRILVCISLFLVACQIQTLPNRTTTEIVIATPTFFQTITPVFLPSSTPTRIMSPTSAETQLCQQSGYLGLSTDHATTIRFSPKNKWMFILCQQNSNGKVTYPFILSKTNGGKFWKVDMGNVASDFIDEFPSVNYYPFYWTNDEKTLYISTSLPCPDSFECWVYEDGEALYKLDLENQKLFTVLPPYISSPRSSYAFSISPDESFIVFVDQATPSVIYIQSLFSGEEEIVKLSEEVLKTGAFVWSLDSQSIAFSTLQKSKGDFFSSIYFYQIPTKQLSRLLEDHPGVLFPNRMALDEQHQVKHWHTPDILYIESVEQGYWYLNVRTRQLTREP